MSDPLPLGGKESFRKYFRGKYKHFLIRNSGIIFAVMILTIFGSVFRLWKTKPVFYAQAYTGNISQEEVAEDLKCEKHSIFGDVENQESPVTVLGLKKDKKDLAQEKFAEKLYEIVGNTPIREMIPFISKRDEKVAAFLVGIAKKESSWGEHVPLQNGKDCYNYWGYKGSASRGSAMGYACFADQKEAVEIVGNRIEVLINKNHTTASKMLVWKCGSSCAGHSPEGVKSWVSTVAMYLDKIVG